MTAVMASEAAPRRPTVLCVDDEPYVLEGLRDVLRPSFEVRVAAGGPEGLQILRNDPDSFAVVISDMRMPGMDGSEFLAAARLTAPDAVRMLLTGHADVHVAIRAVNDAHLFRFLTKPCDSQQLMGACAAAVTQHFLQTADRALLQETLHGSVDALAEVLALTNPAAYGRARRVKELAGKLARAAGLRNWWEVEVAAMLAEVGEVTLPQATAEKLHAGTRLTEPEAAMARRVPLVTRRLIGKIPRLEGVVEILEHHHMPLDEGEADGAPSFIPAGSWVLRIAADYAELESQGDSAGVALDAMRRHAAYDRGLLDLFAGIVGAGGAPAVLEVSVSQLRVGMTLINDARSTHDDLLITGGQRVTERLVERLVNLGDGGVREPLRVHDIGGEVCV
jgi:response regulator RpfG family c-di-GMP phosphodiesterase